LSDCSTVDKVRLFEPYHLWRSEVREEEVGDVSANEFKLVKTRTS
jgi:hypothetical protein